MEKIIIDYIRFGIYNNTLYYPRSKDSIKSYIEELKSLAETLKSKDRSNLLITLKNENPNIFTLSFVLSTIGLCDETFEFLKKNIKTPVDAYVFISFAFYSKQKLKKYILKLYESADLGDYELDCFTMFRPHMKMRHLYNERKKLTQKAKYQIEQDKFTEMTHKDIFNMNIHYKDLGEHLSYKFNIKDKDRLIGGYILKYGIIDILPSIDEWYCESISTEMLRLIESSFEQISDPTDLFKLLTLEKSIKNKNIKAMIVENISEKDLFLKSIPITINVTPSQKHKVKIDEMETYDYLYLFAVGAGLLHERFGSRIVLNGNDVGNDLFEILKKIDGFSASLKSESVIDTNRLNILFSSIMQDDFDIVWDSSTEDHVSFVNVGPLMVFGINYFTIKSLIKIIEEGKQVCQ